ncbi:MAG: shikimate kinase [Porticoccaceae bacterium]|jgi:shikimate kinase|nr:shikimate kinase [Porticoccaceae bacterium]MEA3299562.1 shikimate kinase [Pseudomonadota bacterium]HLS97126.1 shikimate kinase [Porticoccaceae bacterium]
MIPGENLYLVGPMGVGKTTIGRLVAQRLGKTFIDLDEEIEHRSGASIPWIFDVEGEAGFRRRESELLREIAADKDIVLSTGGGVVLSEDNRAVLRATGFVVFLNASVEQLYQRTLKDKKRPLLQVPDRRQVIERLKRDRDPLYRQVAHWVFDVGHRNSRQATDALVQKLRERNP